MKLLIVEDEPDLSEDIASYLQKEGMICEKALSYRDAEDKLICFTYDIVILDITLPDGNGLELLRDIRADHPNTGVLIVSAKHSVEDRITGLDLGADDYITKPFHLPELNARVNALIRRQHFKGRQVLSFEGLEIDTEARTVHVDGALIDLTAKEFDILLYLLTNKNRVLTKENIATHLWGDNMDLSDNFDFIYTHMRNLRKKINERAGRQFIQTIYGLGYKFSEQ